jgi:DNA excision repair protein ERCC-2
MSEKIPRVSVRAMVEFSLRGEDLAAAGDARRMLEGTLAHQARQRAAPSLYAGDEREVSLHLDTQYEGFSLRVQGRADGLFIRDGLLVVEEIKHSFDMRERPEEAHSAQCACYAHILCVQRALPQAVVRVLYVSREGESVCAFETFRDAPSLRDEFERYARAYARFAAQEARHRARRDEALAALVFPYGAYRAGQRALSKNVYIAIRDKRRLLAQAPTGTGKTAAVLFPALKALGEGRCARIVYLTARTTGRALALNTLRAMRAPLRCVELTAKDKLCPMAERRCAPECCPRARGFFLRLDGAVDAALARTEPLMRADIEALAEEHCLCPFEFSLFLAQVADVIVGDYNYLFDPFVRLQFLGPGTRMTLLCDEAHNLPDRVRDMLSAQLDAKDLRTRRRAWGGVHGRRGAVYSALTALIRLLSFSGEPPEMEALETAAQRLNDACAQALTLGQGDAADLFLLSRAFTFAAGRADETYARLWDGDGRARRLRLVCLDGAPHIFQTTRRLCGVVYFSATLSPLRAFRTLLGAQEEDAALSLPSPFDSRNLCLMRLALDTRYAARERSADGVARALSALCRAHAGHYLFLFPSYAYLRLVRERFEALCGEAQVLSEAAGMDEEARAQMLARFEETSAPGETLAGFGVMGGNFSEGVDLPGERLCGVAVVGVGLPMLCPERDALRDYYAARGEDGFHLAYRVPGMIRVLQSAGRVIRSAQDRGTVLLIDTRFFQSELVDLMPAHFSHIVDCYAVAHVEEAVRRFYADVR